MVFFLPNALRYFGPAVPWTCGTDDSLMPWERRQARYARAQPPPFLFGVAVPKVRVRLDVLTGKLPVG